MTQPKVIMSSSSFSSFSDETGLVKASSNQSNFVGVQTTEGLRGRSNSRSIQANKTVNRKKKVTYKVSGQEKQGTVSSSKFRRQGKITKINKRTQPLHLVQKELQRKINMPANPPTTIKSGRKRQSAKTKRKRLVKRR